MPKAKVKIRCVFIQMQAIRRKVFLPRPGAELSVSKDTISSGHRPGLEKASLIAKQLDVYLHTENLWRHLEQVHARLKERGTTHQVPHKHLYGRWLSSGLAKTSGVFDKHIQEG